MASQIVNFLPPSYITTLTTTVTSMSGSISAIQAVDAVQTSQILSMSGSIASIQAANAVQDSQILSMSGSIAAIQAVNVVQDGAINSLSGAVAYPNFVANQVFPPYYDIFTFCYRANRESAGSQALRRPIYPVLPVKYNVTVPLDTIISGTAVDPSQPIFGYTGATYDIFTNTGGVIYSATYTGASASVYSEDSNIIKMFTPDSITSAYLQGLSWFQQRGYSIPAGYIPSGAVNAFYNAQFPGDFRGVYIEPLLNSNGTMSSVKVYANGVFPGPGNSQGRAPFNVFNIPSYTKLSNSGAYDDFKFSPYLLSVTTDYNTFTSLQNRTGCAYYDISRRILTVDIPTGAIKTYDTTFNNPSYAGMPTGSVQLYLRRFAGSFGLLTRNTITNTLDASGYLPEVYCMAQVSPTIFYQTSFETTTNGTFSSGTSSHSYNREGGIYRKFNGFYLGRYNFGNSEFKSYIYNQGGGNAVVTNELNTYYDAFGGDNPNTRWVEQNGSNSFVTYWEGPVITSSVYATGVLTNPAPQPEQTWSILSNPANYSFTPAETIRSNVVANHELMHAIQIGQGSVSCTDSEGQAVHVETDFGINQGCFLSLRARAYLTYLFPLYRGDYNLFYRGNATSLTAIENAVKKETITYASYGSAIFYDYVRRNKGDVNSQFMRRMNDIVSKEYGVLCKAMYPNSPNCGDALTLNPGGCQLASNQAMQDVMSTGVFDVFRDFSVHSVLLQNKLSIPSRYRCQYPYWLWSQSNPMNTGARLQTLGTEGDAYWWDVQQTSNSRNSFPYFASFESKTGSLRYQSFVPSWPRYNSDPNKAIYYPYANAGTGVDRDYLATGTYVSYMQHQMPDMSMVVYQMPTGATGVNVVATSGTIEATVVKFVNDSGLTGAFIQSPSLETFVSISNGTGTMFDLSPFASTPGTAKLVVINNQAVDRGGPNKLNNYYMSSWNYSGQVTITPFL